MTAVCIAGMHRSGTSLIARALNLCGLYLGEAQDMMPPAPDNPEGFWEHVRIVGLNDQILWAFDGGWDLVPNFPANWATSRRLSRQREAARGLIDELGAQRAWGWKDPRNSLTLPFWQRLIPDLKVVVVVRNPVDVWRSLAKRGSVSLALSAHLTHRYYDSLRVASTPSRQIVTHYDAFFEDPRAELRRLARFLGLQVSPSALDDACAQVRQNLRHTHSTLSDLIQSDAPRDAIQEYVLLCQRAGPAYEPILLRELEASFPAGAPETDLSYWKGALKPRGSRTPKVRTDLPSRSELEYFEGLVWRRDAQISQLTQTVQSLTGQVAVRANAEESLARQLAEQTAEKIRSVESLTARLAEGTRAQQTLKAQLAEKTRAEQTLTAQLAEKTQEASAATTALSEIHRSKAWRLVLNLRRMRLILVPQGSLRERIFRALYRRQWMSPRSIAHVTLHRTRIWLWNHPAYWRAVKFLVPQTLRSELNRVEQTGVATAQAPHQDAGDYLEFSERIAALRKIERSALAVERPPLLDLQSSDPLRVAASLEFSQYDEPEVSIIIPVRNHALLTLECLKTIEQRTGSTKYEVVIVDDGSDQETKRALLAIRNVSVIRSETSTGFAHSCNLGAQAARGKYLVFLNNDTQVTERWLDRLLSLQQSCADIGAVGPKLLYPNGRLQEAGALINQDGTTTLIGVGDDPERPRYNREREVDYCSAVCLLLETSTFRTVGGFDESFSPAYYEDVDLCLKLRKQGLKILYCPQSVILHHLSATSAEVDSTYKMQLVAQHRQLLLERWQAAIDDLNQTRLIAFYLPQYHPIPDNDLWWGKGFTEWSNVVQARPNYEGQYQPRLPADLGFYDLRISEIMEQQTELAKRYGLSGFCYYYYWFDRKRLLEMPLERLLETGKPDFPFCLCWANENWSRRWDGSDDHILISQNHSDEDDEAIIHDLMRYLRHPNYIRVNGRPMLLVYRITLFPDFERTAQTWREVCRKEGLGEIHLVMVETFELSENSPDPGTFGMDAAVEFPPHIGVDRIAAPGAILNPDFTGLIADYRDTAMKFIGREVPGHTLYRSVMPGWDNTARRQNTPTIFEHATPGAYEAWLEESMHLTREQQPPGSRLMFINAWNEWAEGNYLEPDRRFGHQYLEATRNALTGSLLRRRR